LYWKYHFFIFWKDNYIEFLFYIWCILINSTINYIISILKYKTRNFVVLLIRSYKYIYSKVFFIFFWSTKVFILYKVTYVKVSQYAYINRHIEHRHIEHYMVFVRTKMDTRKISALTMIFFLAVFIFASGLNLNCLCFIL
jgi:hypothetical protein